MTEHLYFDMVKTPAGGWRGIKSLQWMLWPAYCYRIVAPEAHLQELNLFEEMVLRLARASVMAEDEQADLLSMDIRLIRVIHDQLYSMQYLDNLGKITETGTRVLENDLIEDPELITGYVFQNPYTGKLWDRFITEPQFASVVQKSRSNVLLRGEREYKASVFIQNHPELSPETPDRSAVYNAIRRFRTMISRRERLGRINRDSDNYQSYPEQLTETALSSRIDRVTFIDSQPTKCHIATLIYSRSTELMPNDILAADPFIHGASDPLKEQIFSEAERRPDKPLARRLDDALGRHYKTSLLRYSELDRSFQHQASQRVIALLNEAPKDSKLFKDCLYMEKLYLEAEQIDDLEGKNYKLESALKKARDIFESVYKEMLHLCSHQRCARLLDIPYHLRSNESEHRDHVKKTINTKLDEQKIVVELEDRWLWPNILRKMFGTLNNNKDLDAFNHVVFQCFLGCVQTPGHPLRKTIEADSSLFARTYMLMDPLNKAGHGKIDLNVHDPHEMRLELYRLIRQIKFGVSSPIEVMDG